MPTPTQPAPFQLLRWFAGLSAVVIVLIAVANAWVVTRFLTNHLFKREGEISRDFVQNILVSDGTIDYLRHSENPQVREHFKNTVTHLANMRDMLRANVYGTDRTVLWSSDPTLVGRRFTDNEDLDHAMAGKLKVESGRISHEALSKKEHIGLSPSVQFFVETYIPVFDPSNNQVVGVVELYKAPLALTEAIEEGERQVAIAALGGAIALYVSLFWLIRRADRTMRAQHAKLLEAGTVAALGELASSVSHNIRNPLASIRSSAELSLESPEEHGAECARDIIREVDRISARITELLRLSNQGLPASRPIDVVSLLRGCVADHKNTFQRSRKVLSLESHTAQAVVQADTHLLKQVFDSLLSNAAEAMPPGERCNVSVRDTNNQSVRIEVQDGGAGMSPEVLAQIFRPFFTTKPQGLGLGLPLAKRIVEGLGGSLKIDSRPGEGTSVCIDLPKV
ncbi:MAG: HAMP domain-containing sensor histidine kinase [Burkholderiaceae bacterium]|nr:HAMP domain-containing sensor histidine kinase [Burkholderiaceae bacterium]